MYCTTEGTTYESKSESRVRMLSCKFLDVTDVIRTRSSQVMITEPNSSKMKDSSFVLDLPAIPSQDSAGDIKELESHHEAMFEDDDDLRLTQRSLSSPRAESSFLKPQKITLDRAQSLLADFRKLSPWFPFVTISEESTVTSLARDSPFLLLAILTVAARCDTNIYHQLDHEFRSRLSQMIVVEGRKSLELLQGLIVYLAWYVSATLVDMMREGAEY